MDVDTSYQEIAFPLKEFSPESAAPTITNFNALFYESQSPPRPPSSPPAHQIGKRRSHSPESVSRARPEASSSPVAPSSPLERKFERILSGPLPGAKKPMLEGLGVANPAKRLRRPVFSALGPATGTAEVQPAFSSLHAHDSYAMPAPPRRAFSAMLPPNTLNAPTSPSDEGCSFEIPDMSSPAQAYSKRQQTKTLRRCDGSDNLRPATRGTPVKEMSPRQALNENSPNSARWMVPGFGDNESHGKILPCHRVKEDGLMRVTTKTVS